MTHVIDNLEFGRIPRPSIAHNIDKINELVDYVNENDDLIHNQTYQTVTGINSISGSNALVEMQARDFLLKGNTIVWNQLVHEFATNYWRAITPNATALSFPDANTIKLTVTNNNISSRPNIATTNAHPMSDVVSGHKYLIKTEFMKHTAIDLTPFVLYGTTYAFPSVSVNDTWIKLSGITTATNVNSGTLYISENITNMAVNDWVEWRDYQIFDLTQIYGTGNEPTTVEEFEARFTDNYYPYNSGSMPSVNMDGIKIGNEVCEIPMATYFPNGMHGVDERFDSLNADGAIRRYTEKTIASMGTVSTGSGNVKFYRPINPIGGWGTGENWPSYQESLSDTPFSNNVANELIGFVDKTAPIYILRTWNNLFVYTETLSVQSDFETATNALIGTKLAVPIPTVKTEIDPPIETPIIPESQFTAIVQKNNVVPVPFELTYYVDANSTIDDIIARIEALEQGNRTTSALPVTVEKQTEINENKPDIIGDETTEKESEVI